MAASAEADVLKRIGLDHVEFYVADVEQAAARLVDQYGFLVAARSGTDYGRSSLALRQGDIVLVLTQAIDGSDHPAGRYVQTHGDGVANVALRTDDVRAAYERAVEGGAVPLSEPTEVGGSVVVATIGAFADVIHTLVERRDSDWCPPGLTATTNGSIPGRAGLQRVDHLAVCVDAGELDPCVTYYESALGFRHIFEERIVVGNQAMNSKVVQSASGEVTFTIIEPDLACDSGQIDEFLERHGGGGVQHVALSTTSVTQSVRSLRERGVEFLQTPASYYSLLAQRLEVSAYSTAELQDLNILVDADHAGQLFQIFARSTHPRRTYFFEIIERMGAETFGSGNIKALYEAVEAERMATRHSTP